MREHWLPDTRRGLLLRAALDIDDETALDAWREWCGESEFHERLIDAGSFRLLPMVHARLQEWPDASHIRQLAGIRRRTWLENQIAFRSCAAVLALLEAHDTPSLVFKGVALSLGLFGNTGARGMADFDVLVPRERALDALDALATAGWIRRGERARPVSPFYVDVVHGVGLHGTEGPSCDLHWRAFRNAYDAGLSASLWENAVPLTVAGAATRAPDATHSLMIAIAHGLDWQPESAVRWIVDAVTLIRGGSIDWPRLLEESDAFELGIEMHAALEYLRTDWCPEIPDDVVATLSRMHTSPAKRRLLTAYGQSSVPGRARVRRAWARHRYRSFVAGRGGLIRDALSFPPTLRLFMVKERDVGLLRWSIGVVGRRLARGRSAES